MKKMTEFEAIYESIWNRLAAGALVAGSLYASPVKTMASPAPNTNTVSTLAGAKGVAVPKDRPKDFASFRDDYLFAIFHTKIDGLPMLSSSAETFAGPRFDMILSKYIRMHETGGKYTPAGTKESYVVRNGKNYVQKAPDPSGGYTIGDGISLNAGTRFPDLVAKYLKGKVAFDKDWGVLTNTVGISRKIMYLEASVADAVGAAFRAESRANLKEFLRRRGVDYDSLDAYAKIALEDLAYNQGGNISYKNMLAALAKSPPDYVRAAYEICNCKDWESFGGLRTRRIHSAHLFLMAADRNGGLDIYRGRLGADTAQTPSLPEETEKTGQIRHVVVKGDNLWDLSRSHHSTIDEIASDNNIDPKSPLKIGQVLYIRPVKSKNMDENQLSVKNNGGTKKASGSFAKRPVPPASMQYHTVSSGETFSGIAFKNGIRLNDLKRLNPGKNYNRIKPGERIRIR